MAAAVLILQEIENLREQFLEAESELIRLSHTNTPDFILKRLVHILII